MSRSCAPSTRHRSRDCIAAGFLESAYLVLGSVNNVQKLVDRKLARLRGSPGS